MEANDGSSGSSQITVGAGCVDVFRVEFTPTSQDERFGVFQLYVCGIAMGDGTTTAVYPHYMDLRRLCALAERPGPHQREPLHLGDTFDHLELYVELTETSVVFTFTTRPEWGVPPPWAPSAGEWMRLSVARPDLISAWRQAEPQLRRLMLRR
jgi:hypothetical protein